MPQMMPINWLMSFFFFICIFLIFNIMNYYIYNININNTDNKLNIKKKNINWKW
uniref:ATP synthase complex subunit 8 n=1 Tax=Parallelia stuposa TaxID=2713498 RepID=A0A6G6D7L0_9NEOP|nr:ATP synthase F0 subunit 8 [Parallelia stuposa]QIE12505.1 ATP synthase F0 subunit 8 [Parallelia stuposa]UIF93643.1 ATP synthase F0 subunit 8 [Parallelia stuposa]